MNRKFKTTELANRIKANQTEILRIFTLGGYSEEAKKLKDQLDNAVSEKQIRLVFIGQYTAGKSTIIAALTGNNEIRIDSDIATSVTADYSWNGVTLTDTPGLYTENPEHDARTIEMIKKSDLLIYCITSDLFNQYTLKDFERWAFDVGYSGKMFLIVNKMSKEAGEYTKLVENYSETINKALIPHSVGEFTYSFIDAKDYKDGISDGDRELIEYSHFEDFIVQLNEFIQRKGLLGKLDTPIMILKSSIDELTQRIIDDDSNRAFNALLSRIEKKVDQQRNQMYIDTHGIIERGLRPIANKGFDLSRMVGIEEIDFSKDDINDLIKSCCTTINAQLTELCETSMEHLNSEICDVLNSGAANYFFNSISFNYDGKKHLYESKEMKFCRAQFESIRTLIENITGRTIGMATKEGAASAKFFIKSTEASGSQIHKVVLAVGGKFGHKFKPWEAANIVKNVGNAAKVVGPVLSVIGLFLDVKETVDDQKREQQIIKAQTEYRQIFLDIVSDIESQYSNELDGVFDVYQDISSQLQSSRADVQKLLKSNDDMTKRLLEIRDDLTEIQSEIF